MIRSHRVHFQPIIPQLFSRLNHPVRAVRNRISDLICRIAEDFPHLIIFPAVVGGASSSLTETDKLYKHLTSAHEVGDDASQEDPSAGPGEGDQREDEEADDNPEMQGAYAQIVDAMVKQCGDSVEQVQRFVNELQRISLLWDELWLGTLQQYSGDIAKRIKKMEDEVARLNRNQTLSAEEKKLLVLDKYNIVFKPLLYVFEKVRNRLGLLIKITTLFYSIQYFLEKFRVERSLFLLCTLSERFVIYSVANIIINHLSHNTGTLSIPVSCDRY